MTTFTSAFTPLGSGQLAPRGSLQGSSGPGPAGVSPTAVLAARLETYKKNVAKRYRVVDARMMDRVLPPGPLWISTKIDGELWFLIKRAGEVALCAYNGRVLKGLPVGREAESLLARAGDIIIAGELFAPAAASDRVRVQHVAASLSDPARAEALRFQAFDLVEEGGDDGLSWPYARRLARLNELLGAGQHCGVVTTVEGDAAAAASYYREWVSTQKFEGLVVRSEQGITFKIKPTFTLDAVVIAYGERLGGEVAQLRELSVALRRDDGTLQLLGSVGGGFSDEDRVRWLARLSAMSAPSAFRLANREGTLCRFVRPEIVVEVQCSDLIVTDSDEVPVRRMALRYDPETGYTPLGDERVPAMLFPVFVRERTDKTTDLASIGMTQVTSRLPPDEDEERGPAAPTARSEILTHKAWTKEAKGQTAVRKYAVIAPHKEALRYPPFVVYFTDYSPGRAEPLKTTLRAAGSRERADALVAEWVEENVKKGWNPVGAEPSELPEPPAPKARRRATKEAGPD